jgi:hypothetical protein
VTAMDVAASSGREESLVEDQQTIVTSVRIVKTMRSAKQFARGQRDGILTTSMPASDNTAPNDTAN